MNNTQPRLLIVAGPNGSGKTTVTERGLAHEWFEGCEYINPDFIARDLGNWNAEETIIRAATIAEKKRKECLIQKRSLAVETVFSTSEKVNFLRQAKLAGYFVRLFFVATETPSINASRVAQRVMQGGHNVPIEKILSRYFRSIANCASIAKEVDRLYLYDNSIDGVDARLVLRAARGNIIKNYGTLPHWTAPILEMLEND